MRRQVLAGSVLAVALLLVIPMAGQSPSVPQFPTNNGGLYPDSNDPLRPESPEAKRIAQLNAQRQKALVSDTEKLLRLAKELNEEIAQNNSQRLSSEQLRKVEEIGKLAHSVKDKMSFSVGGFPSFQPLTMQPGIQ